MVWLAAILLLGLCTSQVSAQFDYKLALEKSLLFYEAQRSGKLPADNRIPWRGDSGLEDPVVGGYYDGGRIGKFTYPLAAATTVLLWGMIEFPQAYTQSGQQQHMINCVRWSLDYLMAAHTSKHELVVQIGVTKELWRFWGRPEEMTGDRTGYKVTASLPGSDVAAEAAAALAAGYVALKDVDSAYAATLLQHAKELYEFAELYQGKYSDSLPDPDSDYKSNRFDDELAWGAVWLWRATQDVSYRAKAEALYQKCCSWKPWAFDWNDKQAAVQTLLYTLEDRPSEKAKYGVAVLTYLDSWLPNKGSVDYTPKGLAWRQDWGSLRYAANTAFLATVAAKYELMPEECIAFAKSQLNYILGANGFSFVVGFGDKYPLFPHHAASSCEEFPWPCSWADYDKSEPNVQILNGAVVSGPDKSDVHNDSRQDSMDNKVTLDFNAGFQSALAALLVLG